MGGWWEKIAFLKGGFPLPKESAWKECPEHVEEKRKYSVDEGNNRVATIVGSCDYSTIIGNTPLPPNTLVSWSVKVLESEGDDGDGIYVEVAPSDVDQNGDDNHENCGWYPQMLDLNAVLWTSTQQQMESVWAKERGGKICAHRGQC